MVTLPPAVRALQAPKMPSMQGWLDQVGAAWVDFGPHVGVQDTSDHPDPLAFANINTPADLARIAREIPGGL